MKANENDPHGHQDPKNWMGGIFYFNPGDPRLLPPKPLPGTGYTVNFANWRSVVLLLIFTAAITGLVLLLISVL